MATQDQSKQICGECGATLAPDLRYCLQCYSPVAAGATRVHVELARATTTTHRPDPTIVFSPEKHEAMVRRARSRKRAIIVAATAIAIVAAGAITLDIVNRQRRAAEKAMAREEAARRDLSTLGDALERFRGDVGRYPTNDEGLTVLVRRPAAFPPVDDADHSNYWFGPYLEHVPEVDPWGSDYIYKTADGGRSFDLSTDGPTGETGSVSRFRVTSQASTITDR